MKHEIEKINNNYDVDTILNIWQESFPKLDEKRIKWSYDNNVTAKPFLFCLKTNDLKKNAIGLLTLFPRNFYLKGKQIPCGISGDFAIKKKYRSLGPAILLQKYLLANKTPYDIILGFPNKPAEKIQMRVGFKPIGKINLYIKPIKSSYVLKKIKKSYLAKPFSPVIDLFLKLRDFKHKHNQEIQIIQDPDKINTKFDKLLDSGKTNYSLIGERSYKYLHWRYFENPYKKYSLFAIEDKKTKKLLGYIIYMVHKDIAMIDDFLFNGLSKTFNDLFYNFTSFCQKNGYAAIYLHMFYNTKIDSFLKNNGFIKKITDQNILINNHDFISSYDNLFITKGDDDY